MQIWTEPVFSKQRVIIFSTVVAPLGLRLHICLLAVVSLSTVGVTIMSQAPHPHTWYTWCLALCHCLSFTHPSDQKHVSTRWRPPAVMLQQTKQAWPKCGKWYSRKTLSCETQPSFSCSIDTCVKLHFHPCVLLQQNPQDSRDVWWTSSWREA